MEVELTDHVGYERDQEPRGRAGTLATAAHRRRWRPSTVRCRSRRPAYRVEVATGLISQVTDAVMDDARAWQQRPLQHVYPGAVPRRVRGQDPRRRQRSAQSLLFALGVGMDGSREVPGMWFQAPGGAKFWIQVLTELKQRGVQDILNCSVDGLGPEPAARREPPRVQNPSETVYHTLTAYTVRLDPPGAVGRLTSFRRLYNRAAKGGSVLPAGQPWCWRSCGGPPCMRRCCYARRPGSWRRSRLRCS
jgi:Transposase, Mutator family